MIAQRTIMNKKRDERISGLFCVYLFFVIFRPPVIRIDITYVIVAINIGILLLYMLMYRTLRINKCIFASLIGFVPFLIYHVFSQLIHAVISPENTMVFMQAFLGLAKVGFYIVLTIIATMAMAEMLHINLNGYIRNLEIAFGVQLLLVMASYFVPKVKSIFLNLIYANVNSETVVTATRQESYFRCYGLADNLFDSLGYISALAVVVFLEYGIKNKKTLSVAFSFALLIIPLLNARTGLLLAIVGVIVVILENFDLRKIVKYLFVGGLAILAVAAVYKKLPVEITRWIEVGIKATAGLIHGETNSVYSEILAADFVWPSSILFGAGAAPEVISEIPGIDSGFVQCVWRFGVVGSLFLFAGFFHMFHTKEKKQGYILPMATIFAIYLFKLYGIFNLGSISLIYMLPVLIRRYRGIAENG